MKLIQFSIVVPYFNTNSEFLFRSLQSIENQSYNLEKIEVILINDGGEDRSSTINLFERLNIKHVLLDENFGLSHARNAGMLHSIGNYIIFLDSDDELEVFALSEFESFIRVHEQFDIIFSNSIKYDKDLLKIKRHINSNSMFREYKRFYNSKYNPLFHVIFVGPCILIKKQTITKFGGFDLKLRCGEITDFVLKVYSLGGIILHIPLPLYKYRDSESGLSKSRYLHCNRINSIKKYYNIKFHDSLSEIRFLGRVKYQNHSIYLINSCINGGIRLPYINYKSLNYVPEYE